MTTRQRQTHARLLTNQRETQHTYVVTTHRRYVMESSLVREQNYYVKPKIMGSDVYNVIKHKPWSGLLCVKNVRKSSGPSVGNEAAV